MRPGWALGNGGLAENNPFDGASHHQFSARRTGESPGNDRFLKSTADWKSQLKRVALGYLGSALLVVGLGVLLVSFPFTRTLEDWSFDLPFLWRGDIAQPDVVMIQMDAASAASLGQPREGAWSRAIHTRLLERLTEQGAKLVFFDLLFIQRGPDDQVNLDFAEAMKRHGNVVLIGQALTGINNNTTNLTAVTHQMREPLDLFRQAAPGWGLNRVQLDPGACSKFVRRFPLDALDHEDVPSTTTRLIRHSTNGLPLDPSQPRCINYYGPPGHWASMTYDHALTSDVNRVKGKYVFVGAKPTAGFYESDQFSTPYDRVGREPMPGVEILATCALNLADGDWLERFALPKQAALAAAFGLFVSLGTMRLRPWPAAWLALGASTGVVLFSFPLQWNQHLWWAWLVPMVVQSPIALVWSIGYKYVVVERHGRLLRQTFAAYLSPLMAERIANSNINLELGGEEVEATVMFTDLEGFTTMSESLAPREVSRILTAYFNRTTQAILEQDGTIIKYIGDAVMAVWGAPIAEPRLADRAVLATWGMIEAGRDEITGRRLRTRIGICSGLVLAGNLGSDFRFDYTLIGDTTNFASRLEGLNKYLGTHILISESTCRQLGAAMKTRCLGNFLVVGKQQSVTIHEVLGPSDRFDPEPAWLESFRQGLTACCASDHPTAESLFRSTVESRSQADGPSSFYLDEITLRRTAILSEEESRGAVKIHSK